MRDSVRLRREVKKKGEQTLASFVAQFTGSLEPFLSTNVKRKKKAEKENVVTFFFRLYKKVARIFFSFFLKKKKDIEFFPLKE